MSSNLDKERQFKKDFPPPVCFEAHDQGPVVSALPESVCNLLCTDAVPHENADLNTFVFVELMLIQQVILHSAWC